MGWRVVYIANPARLSTKDASLVIKNDSEEEVRIPIEDISALVVETRQALLSSYLLSELGKSDVIVYLCDEKHLPCASILPFCQHSRALAAVQLQMNASEPFRKNCWRNIARAKIRNQARCLKILGNEAYRELNALASEVKSGDSTNREAVAARIYFLQTLPSGNRCKEDACNAALDYGYAILRGAVARSISAHGFMPSIGVHHKNALNRFNLADDFIEPFRPLVDLWVAQNIGLDEDFQSVHRAKLVALLSFLVCVDDERVTALRAIELLVSSFIGACREKKPDLLKLPELLPLEPRAVE